MSVRTLNFLIAFVLGVFPLFVCDVKGQATVPIAFSCEENEARLDRIAELFEKSIEPENVLIIIGHRTAGERYQLAYERLARARSYLSWRKPAIFEEKIVLAVGERVPDSPSLEFYFGGRLVEKLVIKKGRRLCANCCETNQSK